MIKVKKTHSIMRQVSEINKIPMIKLYKQFADLYKKYGHAYEAFKILAADESKIDLRKDYGISDKKYIKL